MSLESYQCRGMNWMRFQLSFWPGKGLRNCKNSMYHVSKRLNLVKVGRNDELLRIMAGNRLRNYENLERLKICTYPIYHRRGTVDIKRNKALHSIIDKVKEHCQAGARSRDNTKEAK